MAVSQFLNAIRSRLSSNARLLTDASSKDFKQALERWTDINHKTPGAIVMVATEDDIINTVRLATAHNIPYVAKAGGHSAWSTVGPEGTIIDLSNYNKITVNRTHETVRIQGGAQNKQVIEALYAEGLIVPLGDGNTIGTIPQALGGGLCALSRSCGNTSDNIVSARLITASGNLQIVDSSTPDLLWAIKGAGQYFGLVTELELEAYPLEILGVADGTAWKGTYIFSVSQAGDVAKACKRLIDDEENRSRVLYVVTKHPATGAPCLLVLASYFGSTSDAESFFSPISSLNPEMAMEQRVEYTKLNDSIDPFCVKGGYKRFTLNGLSELNAEPWGEIAQIFVDLTKECESVVSGGYGFEFVTGLQKDVEDSAWAHRGVKVWIDSLSWYTDSASSTVIDSAEQKALALATSHVPASEIHIYQNFSRSSTLSSRFGSSERVEKLKALKAEWDPEGVFGGQLID